MRVKARSRVPALRFGASDGEVLAPTNHHMFDIGTLRFELDLFWRV
jgi:hypothetical protein